MSSKKRRKETAPKRPLGPAAALTPRLKLPDPNEGPWAVTAYFADRGAGQFAWPAAGSEMERDLLATFGRLTEGTLRAALNDKPGESHRTALKLVSLNALTRDGQLRLTELLKHDDVDDFRQTIEQLVQLTYCHRPGSPLRAWGYPQFDIQRICLLWWDPEHKVCGWDPRQQQARSGRRDVCPDGACLHPPLD